MKTIFEKSKNCPLTRHRIPDSSLIDEPIENLIPKDFIEPDHGYECDEELVLPEVSEVELVRHYVELSTHNFGVDTGFYPLGSCTMKYNPKINEYTASLPGFATHPYQSSCQSQGSLELMYDLEQKLCTITGMDAFTLQPSAGAHGEFTGITLMKKYFDDKGEKKKFIIIPDSAHGTNPATAAMCQYGVISITSNERGEVSLEELEAAMQQGDIAGIMLTNPNTLGLFDKNILKITEIVHKYGGLTYYDGANMNAMMGKCKPGEMGFDIIHLNLHKTFSTPHGGGGPGSGPVGVKKFLTDMLPNPRIEKKKDEYQLVNSASKSIGKVKAFFGNFSILVRAYTYIIMLGEDGLTRASENAVLNANYLRSILKSTYNLPYDRICQHEFVLNDETLANECTTLDLAKRLLDYGYHAPTIYFPLIVHGAIMIEPTETETKETLDLFAETLKKIKVESEETPDLLKKSPITTLVGRLDEVAAARQPKLKYEKEK
ncbi:MAG: aminomethyl-transferring glycine dehydrogenase subunit GcvPB [Promethearchaeota archaeon]